MSPDRGLDDASGGVEDSGSVSIFAVDLLAATDPLIDVGRRLGLIGETTSNAVAPHERAKSAARAALRLALASAIGLEAARRPFVVSTSGKPSLEPARGEALVHFNLAHCERTALIAVNAAGQVGVDVETARTVRLSDHRHAQLLAAGKLLAPDAALPATSDAAFLQAWVRLEALAKATGEGLGALLGRLADPAAVARTEIDGVRVRVRDVALGHEGVWGAVALAGEAQGSDASTLSATWLPATADGLDAWIDRHVVDHHPSPVTDGT